MRYLYSDNTRAIQIALMSMDNGDIIDVEYFADIDNKDLPSGKYGKDFALEIYVMYGDPKQNKKETIKEYKDGQEHIAIEMYKGIFFADLSGMSKPVAKKLESILIKLGGSEHA